MSGMFWDSVFNGDISQWNVSNVTNMKEMFSNCPIKEEYKPKFK
jgi:surface protein